jgi:hypothetical protein
LQQVSSREKKLPFLYAGGTVSYEDNPLV